MMCFSRRSDQEQIWADKLFKKVLEEIKEKREENGKKVNNFGQLTKELVSCPSFKQVEKELLEMDKETRRLIEDGF